MQVSVCVSERECVREYVLQNFLKSILSRIYANRKASWQPGEACGMRHVAGSRQQARQKRHSKDTANPRVIKVWQCQASQAAK